MPGQALMLLLLHQSWYNLTIFSLSCSTFGTFSFGCNKTNCLGMKMWCSSSSSPSEGQNVFILFLVPFCKKVVVLCYNKNIFLGMGQGSRVGVLYITLCHTRDHFPQAPLAISEWQKFYPRLFAISLNNAWETDLPFFINHFVWQKHHILIVKTITSKVIRITCLF